MPALPASEGMYVGPTPTLGIASDGMFVATSSPQSAPSTPTSHVSINTGQVISSICDVFSSISTSTATSPPCSRGVDVVVVSAISSTPVTSCYASNATLSTVTTVTDSATSKQYRLTEIVSKDKDQFWHQEGQRQEKFELVPPRADIMSVQRRPRQFFPLVELEEDDNDDNKNIFNESLKDNQRPAPKQHLGDAMRRLYYRGDYNKRKAPKVEKTSNPPSLDRGYESEPEVEPEVKLIDHVERSGLRRIQSHPELDDLQSLDDEKNKTEDPFDYYSLHKSKSLPTTPRVSPKLLRKKKPTEEGEEKSAATTQSAGYSFLASIIGGLTIAKAKQEHERKQNERRLIEKQSMHMKGKEPSGVAQKSDNQTVVAPAVVPPVTSQSASTVSSTAAPSSDSSAAGGAKKEDGFMKSFMTWGTTKSVNVSRKEANMWSPASF